MQTTSIQSLYSGLTLTVPLVRPMPLSRPVTGAGQPFPVATLEAKPARMALDVYQRSLPTVILPQGTQLPGSSGSASMHLTHVHHGMLQVS